MRWLACTYLFISFIYHIFGLEKRSNQLLNKGKKLQGQAHSRQEAIYAALEKEKQNREEAQRSYEQKFYDNPELNTTNWQLHQKRLYSCRASRFKDCSYYVGPRGGVYYINYNGRKTYC